MCENCKNAKLCKYKEQVEKFFDTCKETRYTGPDCLEWNWKCKYFEEDMPAVKGKIPTISDHGYKYNEYNWDEIPKDTPRGSDIMKNPCSLCDWYKQRLADPIHIGDSPCQWCNKSPFKVTCTASTETRPEDVQTVTTKTVSRSRESGGMDYNSHTDEKVRASINPTAGSSEEERH